MKVFKYAIYLVLLACAACNLNQQGSAAVTPTAPPLLPTEAPNANPTPDPNLITYNNAAYGYTFEYPANMSLDGDTNSKSLWIDRRINVNVLDKNPETPMGDAPVIESAQDTMIGVNNARYLKGYIGAVGGNTPQRYEAYVIQNDGRYYQFTGYELKNNVVQPIDRKMGNVPPETLALLQLIVSSLRFI
ncbi:MAG: hypothetical protein GC179_31120 [Anaerolineaceae bacterium]|nr:hypothetical protein [Anaerolineaceae bacterium]